MHAVETINLFFDHIIGFIIDKNPHLIIMHTDEFDPNQQVFYLKYIKSEFRLMETNNTIRYYGQRTANIVGFALRLNNVYFKLPFFAKHDQRAFVALFLLRKLVMFKPNTDKQTQLLNFQLIQKRNAVLIQPMKQYVDFLLKFKVIPFPVKNNTHAISILNSYHL